jgi:RNA polymerase sigma factor (sigma-70 family)
MSSPAQAPDGGEAVEALIDRLQPKLKRILGRYRIPYEDAEDILQQSFLDFVYKRPTIYSPDAWLLATVRYRSILYWRQRRNQLHEAMDTAVLEGMAKPEPPGQGRIALRHDLERALCDLPPRSRSLLKLRYGLGLKPAEVAEELGYQASSVRKLTSRCLDRLQRRLQELGFTAENRG